MLIDNLEAKSQIQDPTHEQAAAHAATRNKPQAEARHHKILFDASPRPPFYGLRPPLKPPVQVLCKKPLGDEVGDQTKFRNHPGGKP